ncbi:HlyD family secretion protein [Microbulbifer hainanensis]|uniref:HlyD family secretion protein n=1 Tax=Microbulbifer hainanensis TaxID=2735675 RepID=UPI001867F54D|nr:HlyD family secretion protein [Microbulbifer hainanensis]
MSDVTDNTTTKRYAMITAALLAAIALAVFIWTRLDGSESTDDAYVTIDSTLVAPKVAGFIDEVLVQDNQHVKAGDLLARIEDSDFRAALNEASAGVSAAEANLKHAEASLEKQKAVIQQARANITAGRAEVVFADQERKRYATLVTRGAGSLQDSQQANSRYDAADARLEYQRAALVSQERELQVLRTQRDQMAAHLQQAQAELEKAQLNLSYTRISAPIDGVVANRAVRQGAYVNPGNLLLAIVPVSKAYVVANYRETQLAHIRPGQSASMRVDSIPDVIFSGHVDSIAPATGLEFAPIKPSNATGNFTKVVQRIPVKIVFEPNQAGLGRLRAGMSVVTKIEPSDQETSR